MLLFADIVVFLLALAFAAMGVGALVAPAAVLRQFGVASLTRDGRNEVRSVYGGFGVVIAAMLVLALYEPELRRGICLTVGAALGGMAGGRIVSAMLERGIGRTPASYLVIELFGSAALSYAALVVQPA